MPTGSTDDGHITVSFATLRELAAELEDILKKRNGSLDELHDRVVPVVLSWEGEAREVFVEKLDEWDRLLALPQDGGDYALAAAELGMEVGPPEPFSHGAWFQSLATRLSGV
ncbi:hypothetical protein ABZ092_26755 [Streptomyces bobili]|uniref:WXG100 family type VII secretion target n=1 Tax=Streptomyces bobili TaxID=67280 RepID=UPI0033A0F2CD